MQLDCTEELGRITLTWVGAERNLLSCLPGPLPVDRAHYEYLPEEGANNLTLQKKFA